MNDERPYKDESVKNLEQIFKAHNFNKKVLRALNAELRQRTTKSAKLLRGRVQAQLVEIRNREQFWRNKDTKDKTEKRNVAVETPNCKHERPILTDTVQPGVHIDNSVEHKNNTLIHKNCVLDKKSNLSIPRNGYMFFSFNTIFIFILLAIFVSYAGYILYNKNNANRIYPIEYVYWGMNYDDIKNLEINSQPAYDMLLPTGSVLCYKKNIFNINIILRYLFHNKDKKLYSIVYEKGYTIDSEEIYSDLRVFFNELRNRHGDPYEMVSPLDKEFETKKNSPLFLGCEFGAVWNVKGKHILLAIFPHDNAFFKETNRLLLIYEPPKDFPVPTGEINNPDERVQLYKRTIDSLLN